MINKVFNSLGRWLFQDLKEDIPTSLQLHRLLNKIKDNQDYTPQETAYLIINYPCDNKEEALAQAVIMVHLHEVRIIELENKIKQLTND